MYCDNDLKSIIFGCITIRVINFEVVHMANNNFLIRAAVRWEDDKYYTPYERIIESGEPAAKVIKRRLK